MAFINGKIMEFTRHFAPLRSFYALFRESGNYYILTESSIPISLE